MDASYPTPQEWLRGWREWARTRKRGRMAQFIVEKLEEGKQARWLDISKGIFELTEWHAIAKEWFVEKPRNSEQVDAPCMLRKGLPRAFPGLEELKDQSRKEGTQYRSRVFQTPPQLVQEVVLHITNRPPGSITHYPPDHAATTVGYQPYTNGTGYYHGLQQQQQQLVYNGGQSPLVKLETPTPITSVDYGDADSSLMDGPREFLELLDNPTYPITSAANGTWYSQPAGGMLGIPGSPGSATGVYSGDELSGSIMSSPGVPSYISPSNSPSLPNSVSDHHHFSQPNSVPDHHLTAELSPAAHGSPTMMGMATNEEPETTIELLSVKAVPNSSGLEGGGTVALVFYQQLPLGNKLVSFASRANPGLILTQQAFVENALVLTSGIPKYPHPEEVDVRVYTTEGILLASTPFTFYDISRHNSDMMLQILSQQLQSYFPGGTANAGGVSGATSYGTSGATGGGYGYNVPNAVYQLLLGACRIGCEPLVACLLSLPAMSSITLDQLQQACDVADGCGHSQLSSVLVQMVAMHNMPYEPALMSRGGQADTKQEHVDEYYAAMNRLTKGGSTPKEQAATVMQQLLTAIEHSKKDQQDSVDKLTQDMESVSVSTRRHSYLHHQPHSISDEDEEPVTSESRGRPSLSEQSDIIAPLPNDDSDRLSMRKQKISPAISDADSAIGMSFEDDSQSILLSEVQRRKSSSLVPADFVSVSSDSSNDMAITVKLPPDAGIEVAHSLNWRTAFFVAEDYPPASEHKIFYRGDQFIQIGSKSVSGLSREEFSELFEDVVSGGTSVKIIPQVDSKESKPLRRMPSDHAMFESVTRRVNHLLNMKSSSTIRTVSLPHTTTGFGVKMIGGKSVGVFISDVRSGLTSVAPGDRVLEINGHRTDGLTLYEATQLLRTSSGDLELSVIENKAKFQSVREHFDLDSFYVRSRVDHIASSFRDMSLKKGMLLHVVNTFIHAPSHWLAWAVDEDTGVETHLRRIPSPAMAKKQFKVDTYDSIEKTSPLFPRPVCLIGPDSSRIATTLTNVASGRFTLCSTLDETLKVFAKGSQHAIITDPSMLANMVALHPIVLQTEQTMAAPLREQVNFSKFNVTAFLNSSESGEQLVDKVTKIQHQPVWTSPGILSS